MKKIAKILHGSQLYGLSHEKSDFDYHQIFIPTLKDVVFNTVDNSHIKSDNDDVQKIQLFSFCEAVKNGEMRALESLFAPDEFVIETSDVWETLRANRHDLLGSDLKDALGYCNTHARYHVFDNRMKKELEEVVIFLSTLPQQDRLGEHADLLSQHYEIFTKKNGITHLVIANRKAPFTVTIAHAKKQYEESLENINRHERKKRSDENGIDWKGYSHVCRVMKQVKDVLKDKNLIVPIPEPERTFFMNVKQGLLPYEDVAAYIDNTYSEILELPKTGSEIDAEWLDGFVLSSYETYWKGN